MRDRQRDPCRWPLSFIETVFLGVAFFSLFVIGNRLVRFACQRILEFDCPRYWPISVFTPRAPPNFHYPNLVQIATAGLTLIVFVVGARILARRQYPTSGVLVVGTLLILGSNLTQGWQHGFVRPIDGLDVLKNQYYHDAIRIENPIRFVSEFTEIQHGLLTHSRSHPPGAVLAIYFLNELLDNPALISIAITIVSVSLTVIFFHKLLSLEFSRELSGYLAFLLILLPSIQIYYAASLDALITGLMLGVIAVFVAWDSNGSLVVATALLLAVSFLTFGFLFLLPVLAGYEWVTRRKVTRSISMISSIAAAYLLVSFAQGFNYFESFRIASTLENPQGYRLLAEPLDFIVTRIEGIAEILLFLGPYVLLLGLCGFAAARANGRLAVLSLLGIATLGFVFLTGAFRTGETARAAMIIYPLLVLPVGYFFANRQDEDRSSRSLLASLVFGQTLIMQMVGDYFW